jgi:hypothetical protein
MPLAPISFTYHLDSPSVYFLIEVGLVFIGYGISLYPEKTRAWWGRRVRRSRIVPLATVSRTATSTQATLTAALGTARGTALAPTTSAQVRFWSLARPAMGAEG